MLPLGLSCGGLYHWRPLLVQSLAPVYKAAFLAFPLCLPDIIYKGHAIEAVTGDPATPKRSG